MPRRRRGSWGSSPHGVAKPRCCNRKTDGFEIAGGHMAHEGSTPFPGTTASLAQWQSSRLLSGMFRVQIPGGAPNLARDPDGEGVELQPPLARGSIPRRVSSGVRHSWDASRCEVSRTPLVDVVPTLTGVRQAAQGPRLSSGSSRVRVPHTRPGNTPWDLRSGVRSIPH